MRKKGNFEVCARAVIMEKGNLWVCKSKKRDYYFFPGGHVEFGETAKQALSREIKEELGLSISNFSYLGTVENIYTEDKKQHHEINIVFKAHANKIIPACQEDHIDYALIDIKKEKIYPLALRAAVMKWIMDGKAFWASQN